jgi:hypothetical protein
LVLHATDFKDFEGVIGDERTNLFFTVKPVASEMRPYQLASKITLILFLPLSLAKIAYALPAMVEAADRDGARLDAHQRANSSLPTTATTSTASIRIACTQTPSFPCRVWSWLGQGVKCQNFRLEN